jgi:non-heme chloroperoxidase
VKLDPLAIVGLDPDRIEDGPRLCQSGPRARQIAAAKTADTHTDWPAKPNGSRKGEDVMTESAAATIVEHEFNECDRVNATRRQPVVFIHGLWLLPNSWDRWASLFEEAGYAVMAPGWPDDPDTVEEAKAHPEVFAGKSVGQVADHYDAIIRRLERKPAVIGHSFGGLLTQIIAGRGLSAASVAIDPAPFRGVLPLPISALKSASPVLRNPANRNRAVPLTFDQFRFAFANVVDEAEAHQLYDTYSVPTAGKPLFQAAAANLNPWTEVKVDTENPDRGPLLIISGEKDNTVPWSITNASFGQQKDNASLTEIVEIPNRGHSLTIDSGWREVADKALDFIKRFVQP